MSTPKTLALAGALVLSAVLGGTLMSAVAASQVAPARQVISTTASDEPSTTGGAANLAAGPAAPADLTAYCETFRAAFAKNLGVTEDAVRTAARDALASTIDAAVKAGDLTVAAGDRIKARVANAGFGSDVCRRIANVGAKGVGAALGVVRHALTAAADALAVTPADLRQQLAAGGDLKAIAASKGVAYDKLTKVVIDAVRTDLDAAVKAGTIKQAREDAILDRLTDRLATGVLRPAR